MQKRPTIEAKETYYRGKRDPLQRQKRPTNIHDSAVCRCKRDLLRLKRDLLYMGIPEVCVSVKRDLINSQRYLIQSQKRPVT
jgi:hypothetical protein